MRRLAIVLVLLSSACGDSNDDGLTLDGEGTGLARAVFFDKTDTSFPHVQVFVTNFAEGCDVVTPPADAPEVLYTLFMQAFTTSAGAVPVRDGESPRLQGWLRSVEGEAENKSDLASGTLDLSTLEPDSAVSGELVAALEDGRELSGAIDATLCE